MGCACVRNADMSVDIDVDKTMDVNTDLDTTVNKIVDKDGNTQCDKVDNTQSDKVDNTQSDKEIDTNPNTIEPFILDDRIPSVVEDIVSTQSIHLDIAHVDDNYVQQDAGQQDEWYNV
jgi:hypothetical protein